MINYQTWLDTFHTFVTTLRTMRWFASWQCYQYILIYNIYQSVAILYALPNRTEALEQLRGRPVFNGFLSTNTTMNRNIHVYLNKRNCKVGLIWLCGLKLPTHWSYCHNALSHQYAVTMNVAVKKTRLNFGHQCVRRFPITRHHMP